MTFASLHHRNILVSCLCNYGHQFAFWCIISILCHQKSQGFSLRNEVVVYGDSFELQMSREGNCFWIPVSKFNKFVRRHLIEFYIFGTRLKFGPKANQSCVLWECGRSHRVWEYVAPLRRGELLAGQSSSLNNYCGIGALLVFSHVTTADSSKRKTKLSIENQV